MMTILPKYPNEIRNSIKKVKSDIEDFAFAFFGVKEAYRLLQTLEKCRATSEQIVEIFTDYNDLRTFKEKFVIVVCKYVELCKKYMKTFDGLFSPSRGFLVELKNNKLLKTISNGRHENEKDYLTLCEFYLSFLNFKYDFSFLSPKSVRGENKLSEKQKVGGRISNEVYKLYPKFGKSNERGYDLDKFLEIIQFPIDVARSFCHGLA